jgi:anti-sigma factor (TIGR02949 family)
MGTTRQFTCKHLLRELTDYLDGSLEAEVRVQLEAHLAKCPNCWVELDTIKKTIQVFKGMDPYPLPDDVKSRLMKALQKRCGQSGQA